MTVNAIKEASFVNAEPPRKNDPWAILAVLSLVRNTLAKGQQKIALSTEKLIESGSKIQDKQQRDFKEMDKINLKAVKEMLKSEAFRNWSVGIAIAAIVIVAPAFAGVKLGAVGIQAITPFIASILSLVSSGLQIHSDTIKKQAAEKLMEVAVIQERVSVDAGLSDANSNAVNFSGSTLTDNAKARVSVQKTITDVINSTGSAMQIAAR